MPGLFPLRWIDPNERPRIEHRRCGPSVLDEQIILVDRHGAERRVVDYVGREGAPIEECISSRGPRVNTQYRVFVLQPLERSARLYAFDWLWESRDYSVYTAQRLQSQLTLGQAVRFPSFRPIDARSVITRGHPLRKPKD